MKKVLIFLILVVFSISALWVNSRVTAMSKRDHTVERYSLQAVERIEFEYSGTELLKDLSSSAPRESIPLFYENVPANDVEILACLSSPLVETWNYNSTPISCVLEKGKVYFVNGGHYFKKGSVDIFPAFSPSPWWDDYSEIHLYNSIVQTTTLNVVIPRHTFNHRFYESTGGPVELTSIENDILMNFEMMEVLLQRYNGKDDPAIILSTWNKYKTPSRRISQKDFDLLKACYCSPWPQ